MGKVDKGPVLADQVLQADIQQGIHHHRGGGLIAVGYLRPIHLAGAIEQLIGMNIKVSVVDGLAADICL